MWAKYEEVQKFTTVNRFSKITDIGSLIRCSQSTGHIPQVRSACVTAPQMNCQTTQIPLYLIEHFVKSLGLANTFNSIHLSVSW